MLPVTKNPLGFCNLRTWQQANEIFDCVESLCTSFPPKHPITGQYLTDLKDQMIRSARSVVRNIEEGFARTTTREYIQFLGYSYGSLQELIGDLEYCIKGQIGESQWADKGYYLAKGEAKMLTSQIKSLELKMTDDHTLSRNEQAQKILNVQKQQATEAREFLAELDEIIHKKSS